MKPIHYAVIAAFVLGLGFGWLLTTHYTTPCPTYEQETMDSLQLLRGQHKADSIELAHRAERIKFVIDSTIASIKPISQQVKDAYSFSRTLSPDSLAAGLRATPPTLRTGPSVAPVDER